MLGFSSVRPTLHNFVCFCVSEYTQHPARRKSRGGGAPARNNPKYTAPHTRVKARVSQARQRGYIWYRGSESRPPQNSRSRARRPSPRTVACTPARGRGCPLQSVVDPIDLLRLYISGSRAVYSQLILRGPAACWRPDHEPDTGRRNLRTALRRGRSSTSTEDARSWSRIHAVTHERCMSAAAASS